MLVKASFFDKRFSKLGFLSSIEFPDNKEITKSQIVAEVTTELGEVALEFESETSQETCTNVVSSKKARFMDGIGDSEFVDDVSKTIDPKEEISRYLLERTISANENPLLWWKRNQDIYPLMSQLALKYLCIQATSTDAERSFSLLGNILTKKRMSLSDSNVNVLTFLSDCM